MERKGKKRNVVIINYNFFKKLVSWHTRRCGLNDRKRNVSYWWEVSLTVGLMGETNKNKEKSRSLLQFLARV